MPTAPSRKAEFAVLAVACVLPTLVTLVYFVWAAAATSGVQQAVYGAAKLVQFSLPVVWVGIVCRERLFLRRWTWRGMGLGVAFGLAVGLTLWLLSRGLAGTELLDSALEPIRAKIKDAGLATPARFIALGTFYAAIHSLLEEYYWRWFVFARLERNLPWGWAVAISAVAFSAHHVVVLLVYFSHAPLVALLLAACVGVGGAVWAWLYHRSHSIYAVWVSHLIVDAAIFAVGYQFARAVFVQA